MKGNILKVLDSSIIIETNNIGYEIFVTDGQLLESETGKEIELWTVFVVREQSQELFGFKTLEEKNLYTILLSVSGVGPKNALNIISLAEPRILISAILQNNTDYLTRVSGIGKKTATRIILDLKDKIEREEGSISMTLDEDVDVMDALITLGYSNAQARSAIKQIDNNIEKTEEKISAALKVLSN